ncbi:bile acid:sodium symporter [Paenibacillus sp. N3/727]|uniref:bile acid:sodium symporter family protein n=1 Tax=Paenibacillus sp. N3/727 TaxID=2925845 RepID=UPI001F52F331|nr:bile acid:sodium symporter [Paenibacillus sp. N3/727]UNK17265.1 bile acid:sodium symporter [Paenibacillus sp. N3/727]
MKQFGLSFAACFEKYTFILIPGSLVMGWFLSNHLLPYVSTIPYLFGYITLVMALGCGIGHLRAVMRRPLPVILTLLLAHAAAPLLAYGLGTLVFGPHSEYTTGLVLFAIIPLGVSSVLWVGSSGGSVPFILSVVVLDTLLSPLVVPALMELYFGTASLTWDMTGLVIDLLQMVVLPTVVGVVLYELSKGRAKAWSAPVAQPLSKIAFMLVVMLNAAAIAPHAAGMRQEMVIIVPIVIVLICICYGLGYYGAFSLPNRTREMQVTLTYASGMRNISLGMVLATAYFSPKASVPVVLSIMFQQPAATIIHSLLRKFKQVPNSPLKEEMDETVS